MNNPTLIASLVTGLIVLVAVIYRLLWGASQVAGLSALGRLPKLPKSWRRWLFGERNNTSN